MPDTPLQPCNYQTFDPQVCNDVPPLIPESDSGDTLIDRDRRKSIFLKKQLGPFNGVAIIAGSVIGSGIFVSPRGVLKEAGSVGLSLFVWIACGCLTTIGALCYAELGTAIPESGGDYAYIKKAFGPLPAFLFLYVALFIVIPAYNAVGSLTFALYVLSPFYPDCEIPRLATQLIASSAICLLTFVNCYNVKWAAWVQNVFTSAKVFALGIIILAGLFALFQPGGGRGSFQNVWANTTHSPGKIALSFYSGLFSYSGWNYLNFVTEELHEPYKNLPKAIYISLPAVSVIYVLANVAYFSVLKTDELLISQTVAVSFGDRVLGSFAWTMPFAVALSAFGGLNGAIFASSRLLFAGARAGHMPSFFKMINVNFLSPMPSLIFLSFVTMCYSFVPDIYDLINYTAFSEAIFVTLCVSSLLWLRYTRPDIERPIRVPIVLPIIFLTCCLFLVLLPIYVSPYETAISLAITLSGIPLYFVTIYWESKPPLYKQTIACFTKYLQRFLLSVEEGEEIEHHTA